MRAAPWKRAANGRTPTEIYIYSVNRGEIIFRSRPSSSDFSILLARGWRFISARLEESHRPTGEAIERTRSFQVFFKFRSKV